MLAPIILICSDLDLTFSYKRLSYWSQTVGEKKNPVISYDFPTVIKKVSRADKGKETTTKKDHTIAHDPPPY